VGSYSLADFVAFDLLAWRTLIGRYWSEDGALILTMAALLVVVTVFGIYKQKRWSVYLALALCWVWLALRFHGQWHQQLNWAAGYWVWAFMLQAGLLITVFLLDRRESSLTKCQVASLTLPWLVPLLVSWLVHGDPWWTGEWVTATPDPTAWFTLTVVLLLEPRILTALLLSIIPTLSMLLSTLVAVVLNDIALIVINLTATACVVLTICTLRIRQLRR